tara:strand:- start:2942 stop:3424 length:483 start_codon:yes stop_codon:yes gene_type:complete
MTEQERFAEDTKMVRGSDCQSNKDQGDKGQAATTAAAFVRSECPITCALDIVGDKWTLVVLRDLAAGMRRYKEFQGSPERIPTNILSDRLKKLEQVGMVERHEYQQRPTRYEYVLMDKGRAILPVLKALALWALEYVPGCEQPPEWFWAIGTETESTSGS